MIANFYEKGGKKESKKAGETDRKEALNDETLPLMTNDEDDSIEDKKTILLDLEMSPTGADEANVEAKKYIV